MNNYIATNDELNNILAGVKKTSEEFKLFAEHIDTLVNSLNNNELVQSLYASGKFGDTQRQKLELINNSLKKYASTVFDGGDSLTSHTEKYVEKLIQANNTGK